MKYAKGEVMSQQTPFEKAKYLGILKSQGAESALSALHDDLNLLEIETFEGTSGYQPKLLEVLKKMREFSRELWDLGIAQEEASLRQ